VSSSSSEESPVAAILHLSGECLCGAFGSPDELQDLEWAYPRAAAWIRALERRAAFFGVERDRWGGEPGETARGRARPMCSDCEQRQQLALEGLAAGCPASPRARVRVHQRREGDLGEMAVRVHTPGRTPGPDAIVVHGAAWVVVDDRVRVEGGAVAAMRAPAADGFRVLGEHPETMTDDRSWLGSTQTTVDLTVSRAHRPLVARGPAHQLSARAGRKRPRPCDRRSSRASWQGRQAPRGRNGPLGLATD